MGLSPWSTVHRAVGTVTEDTATETYDLVTRGREGLIVALDVTAIGVGHSFVQGTAITLPLIVATGVNDEFVFDGDTYTVAAGTYSTLTQVKNAVAAAVKTGPVAFSVRVTVTVSGTGLKFTSVASGVHAEVFAVGTNDVLVSLGIANGWTIAHTEAAGADGTASMTLSILGVLPISGKTYVILAAAAVTSVSTKILQVHPTIVASANLAVNAIMPARVRLQLTHTTDDAVTASLESILTP